MIMMVGIPGSGKSTVANRLIEETGDIWVRVVRPIFSDFLEQSDGFPSLESGRAGHAPGVRTSGAHSVQEGPQRHRGPLQLRHQTTQQLGQISR